MKTNILNLFTFSLSVGVCIAFCPVTSIAIRVHLHLKERKSFRPLCI